MPQNIVDRFDASHIGFTFLENDSDVDGVHILAKVSGPACFDSAASRNKRWYPEGHWPKQFAKTEVQQKLQSRLMFGAWGHERELTDEELAEGKHSHITTKLWMDGRTGMAEYLLLNTPAGRVLNTTIRAGSKLSVSTRGSGDYDGEHEGMPQVDPESFTLDRIDFVVNPGFLNARPDLVEVIREDLMSLGINIPKKQEKHAKEIMMPEVNETLVRENATLRSDLSRSTEQLDELKASNSVLADQNEQFRRNEFDLTSRLKEAQDKLTKYETQGATPNLKSQLDRLAKLEVFFSQLSATGLADNSDLTDQAGRMSDAFDFLESRNSILKKIEEDFGNYERIDEAITSFQGMLSQLKPLGTVYEISEMTKRFECLLNATTTSRSQRQAANLSRKFGVAESLVLPLVSKGVSETEIAKIFNSVKGSKRAFRKEETTPSKTKTSATARALNGRMGERLMSHASGMRSN